MATKPESRYNALKCWASYHKLGQFYKALGVRSAVGQVSCHLNLAHPVSEISLESRVVFILISLPQIVIGDRRHSARKVRNAFGPFH